MSLAIVNSVASSFNPSDIEAEVSLLRSEANNAIGPREVARSFINTHLQDMPVLVEGEHPITYLDDRDEKQTKMQPRNLSLWCAALQTTIEIGHTSYDLLTTIFRDWAKNTLDVEWSKESARGVAKKYVNSMQELNILSDKITKMDYLGDDGKMHQGIVVKLSDTFREMMVSEVETLREHTSMKCRPLRNVPMDWVDAYTGIGTDANIPLVKGYKLKSNKISKAVLEAVNKLQHVGFVVSEHMIDAAYDILDNQHEYDSTEEELRMYREITTYEKGTYFFPITMDTRGRMYYRGGMLTPQGSDFCKAAFQFAEFVPLGEDGIYAIKIHLANCFGQDKSSIIERMAWVDDNHESLLTITDHRDVADNWPKADVFQATVAAKEYQRIMLARYAGTPFEDIKSNLVCHQDGTCNGLQHMAAITKNRQTAITVNCVDSTWEDEPQDIYGIVSDAAQQYLDGDALALVQKYGRNMAKNPVMIVGYGAQEATVIRNTAKFLLEKSESAEHAEAIGKAYMAAIDKMAGAVKAMTHAIKSRVNNAYQQGMFNFKWETADGFVACTEYRDYEINRVRAGVFNALVRNMYPAPVDEIKTVGAMAPNFIHSIDAAHLRGVVRNCNHPLVTIHDSIGSHAGTYFETARVIREQFVEVHQYDAMDNLCANMEQRTPKFRGDYSVEEALQSSYIFS